MVVDLAVDHGAHAAIGGRERLPAAGEVDDSEPLEDETDVVPEGQGLFVGAAMSDRAPHALENRHVTAVERSTVEMDDSGDPAHR